MTPQAEAAIWLAKNWAQVKSDGLIEIYLWAYGIAPNVCRAARQCEAMKKINRRIYD